MTTEAGNWLIGGFRNQSVIGANVLTLFLRLMGFVMDDGYQEIFVILQCGPFNICILCMLTENFKLQFLKIITKTKDSYFVHNSMSI